jgi:hypothetical protein
MRAASSLLWRAVYNEAKAGTLNLKQHPELLQSLVAEITDYASTLPPAAGDEPQSTVIMRRLAAEYSAFAFAFAINSFLPPVHHLPLQTLTSGQYLKGE